MLLQSRSHRMLAAGAVLLAAVAATGISASAGAPTAGKSRSRGLMVAFKPGYSLAARQDVLRRHGLNVVAADSRHMAKVAPLDAQAGPAQEAALVAAVSREPAVRVAEPDYEVYATALPNDPRFGELWGMHNTGQNGGPGRADIDAPEAWDKTAGTGAVIVAIIDTGVDYNHPDLRDNILRDASGRLVGWDYANGDADPMDDNKHGTHVAGTIGAVGDNGIGVVGVCPRVRIMPLKFLAAGGSGSTSDAIKCIDYAVAHGARVLNNSWGGGDASQLLKEAIDRARAAGVLVVAAAGNESLDNDASPSYPAAYNAQCDNVLSVAATDDQDRVASFSNYGARSVDIAAPGVSILSTVPGGGYEPLSGTSMATPMVSGAAALVLSRYPGISVPQLVARLLANTDRPASLTGRVAAGRLNVNRALVEDGIAPGAPSAFTVTHRAATALRLAWTASGDDGAAGSAAGYDLRFSTTPITDANFGAASAVSLSELPKPGTSGAAQSFLLSGLSPNRGYYLALRAMDRVGAYSPLALFGPAGTVAATGQLTAFSDTVEGAPQFAGTAGWAVTTESSSTPTHSYTDSPGARYRNSVVAALTANASISLSGFVPALSFRAKTDLEEGFDFLYVEVSPDGGASWHRQARSFTGTADWASYEVPLARYYGQSVRVRFRLVTDADVVRDGVWLDDIRIGGDPLESAAGAPPAGPAAPAPPTGLAASAGSGSVALAWSASSGATSYRVKRSSVSGGPYTVVAGSVPGTGYTDTSVANGSTYHYVVSAANSGGESANSSQVSATPRAPVSTRPAAPTNLRAQLGTRNVQLQWTQSPTAGVVRNRIYRATKAGGPYTLLTSVTLRTRHTDYAVQRNTRYYYVVTAVTAAGESSSVSNEASAGFGRTWVRGRG